MPSPFQSPLRSRSYSSAAASSPTQTTKIALRRYDVLESIVARGKAFVQRRRTRAPAKTPARVRDGLEPPAKNVLRRAVAFYPTKVIKLNRKGEALRETDIDRITHLGPCPPLLNWRRSRPSARSTLSPTSLPGIRCCCSASAHI